MNEREAMKAAINAARNQGIRLMSAAYKRNLSGATLLPLATHFDGEI